MKLKPLLAHILLLILAASVQAQNAGRPRFVAGALKGSIRLDGRLDEPDWSNVFVVPVNWRLESGDRFEINYNPQGESLSEPFEIAENVVIPVGSYHFTRYRLEAQSAANRLGASR